jgi:hypothetical protein
MARTGPDEHYDLTASADDTARANTGEADRIDGPYYAFKLIQTLRSEFPQWMPFVGPEGGPLNLVPVDFVARAMDHIAHLDGLDNRAFHLVDPAPLSLGDTLNTFCRAAHAPEFALRFDRRMTKMIPGDTLKVVGSVPAIHLPYAAGQRGTAQR